MPLLGLTFYSNCPLKREGACHAVQGRGLILMQPRDKNIFPAEEAGVIKWADEGGRFVVSSPSVVYNGAAQLSEPFRGNITTDFSYEVFGADSQHVYYGTYRCIKRVSMDWDVLMSFGQEVSTGFNTRTNFIL